MRDEWYMSTGSMHGDINAKGKTLEDTKLFDSFFNINPTKCYKVDWDKVQTPQDLISIVKAIYPEITIVITEEAHAKVKHLLLNED